MGRLLTLKDLYEYYSSNFKSSVHFSAKDGADSLVVQVDGNLVFDKDADNTEGLTPVVLQSCHIDKNLNNSYISKETMEAALPSFANRPILGYIHEVDGQLEFYDHRMHMDNEGGIVYDEVPVGVIPESSNAKLEYDSEKDKTYVVVSGYIFDEYSKAAEIIEREQVCPVSVELSIRELSYNAKDKYLNIEDFFFSGVTILGKNPDGSNVEPGMEGANIMVDKSDIKSDFSIQNFREGGKTKVNKFEELLEKYGKTTEDIDFDYSEMTDEELEAKFAEIFDETEEEDEPEEPVPGSEESEEVESEEDEEKEESGDIYQKVFELSHNDIRCKLYELLDEKFANTPHWYWITQVWDTHFGYEDDNDPSLCYDQDYAVVDDVVSFIGEPKTMHKVILSDEEFKAISDMRAEHDAAIEKLAKYEAEPEKLNILNSEDYVKVADTEEFKTLKTKDGHFDLSIEEVSAKADAILLAYAKSNIIEITPSKVGSKHFADNKKKTSRYGNLFSSK